MPALKIVYPSSIANPISPFVLFQSTVEIAKPEMLLKENAFKLKECLLYTRAAVLVGLIKPD